MRTWPNDWEMRKRGQDCPFCAEGRVERNQYGIRVFAGQVSDAYLQRFAPLPGYTIVVWRGRHTAEPTELTDPEACAYELEVLRVARALQEHYQPAQVNYLTLGNQIPHVHTNVVLRYVNDSAPGGTIDLSASGPVPDEELEEHATAIRRLLMPEASAPV